MKAQWIQTRRVDPPQTIRSSDGRVWLISRTPLDVPSQQASVLEVRQDITASVARSQRDLLLLIAAAGGSVLFTSVLLRLVIWRGLIQPLRGFTRELEQLEADSLGTHTLSTAEQPSEFRSIVEAFNQLQARLSQAWQRERRFVDGVAHELRTPITVISSHAQRLQAAPTQSSPAALALIAAEAKRLGELIAVMLDFARVDAGRLALAVDDLDPEALLLEAFERLQGLAPERLQLAPSVEGDLPAFVLMPIGCTNAWLPWWTTPCVTPRAPCSWVCRHLPMASRCMCVIKGPAFPSQNAIRCWSGLPVEARRLEPRAVALAWRS